MHDDNKCNNYNTTRDHPFNVFFHKQMVKDIDPKAAGWLGVLCGDDKAFGPGVVSSFAT